MGDRAERELDTNDFPTAETSMMLVLLVVGWNNDTLVGCIIGTVIVTTSSDSRHINEQW